MRYLKYLTIFFISIIAVCITLHLFTASPSISIQSIKVSPSYKYNTSRIHPVPSFDKTVKSGDSVFSLLKSAGCPDSLINDITVDINNNNKDLVIKAGQKYSLDYLKDSDYLNFDIKIDSLTFFSIHAIEGEIKTAFHTIDYKTKYSVAYLKIDSSLFESLNEIGLSPVLAYELNNIFLWDIDFNTEIYKGDSVIFIFESRILQTGEIKAGSIISARFDLHGKSYEAYSFPSKTGLSYYTYEGNSIKKAFMRSPLKYTRISSRFTYKRFHPILRIYRPHLGIDYAAPPGSPVMATAKGKIIYKAWDKKGGGNTLKIRHNNGFQTTYMHLKSFAKGIKRGSYVSQGQIIAYVGSTGLSTGPHLDYRVKKNGKYINPLKLPNFREKPLAASYKPLFTKTRDKCRYFMRKIEEDKQGRKDISY